MSDGATQRKSEVRSWVYVCTCNRVPDVWYRVVRLFISIGQHTIGMTHLNYVPYEPLESKTTGLCPFVVISSEGVQCADSPQCRIKLRLNMSVALERPSSYD